MQRLIIFRHGKAEAHSPSGEDIDRPLASRGVREAAETAGKLAGMGFSADLALVSAAERTRQTWAAAAPFFPGAYARFVDQLYFATPGHVRRIAEDLGSDADSVIVVGHNPGLHELTLSLLVKADAGPDLILRARQRFPTAAAAVFRLRPDIACEGLFLPERWD